MNPRYVAFSASVNFTDSEIGQEIFDQVVRSLGIPAHLLQDENSPMTESEWLSSNDPQRMLYYLMGGSEGLEGERSLRKISDRRLRLFSCAVGRLIPKPSQDSIAAIDRAEAFADGVGDLPSGVGLWFVWHMDAAKAAQRMLQYVAGLHVAERRPDQQTMASLLREISGNPFRSVTLCGHDAVKFGCKHIKTCCIDCHRITAHNDNSVVKIAQTIYTERRFDLMPILGDSLEEAGCDNEDILRHCRGQERCWAGCDRDGWQLIRDGNRVHSPTPCPTCKRTGWIPLRGPYVLGDWCLDLLLGKD